jgi:hypothetical protein
MVVKGNAVMREPQQPSEQPLAILDRLTPDILTFTSSRSKAQRMTRPLRTCPRIRSNTASPFASHAMASASTTHDLTESAWTAAAASEKRLARSFPLRVKRHSAALAMR